jgi:hypothetical protein
MRRSPSRWLRGVPLAVPGVALAGFGTVHPAMLDAATAPWWARLHVILLPVFPLLAVAQWTMLAPAPRWLRWPGRLAAFGFAAFYTGLDAVAGIAAGTVVSAAHGPVPVLDAVFAIGDTLGAVGAWAFLVGNVVICTAVAAHARWHAVPGSVFLLTASVSFLDSHIFWPRGVVTMVAAALGMYLLGVADQLPEPRTRSAPAPHGSPA